MTSFPAIPSQKQAPATHPDSRIVLAIRGPGFGAEMEPTPAADATAWILVALLVFCVVWIVSTAILLRRRLRKQVPLADLETESQTHCKTGGGRPAWEKPEDWWKH